MRVTGSLISAAPDDPLFFEEGARVQALSKMCISMYAGELDQDWAHAMQQQSKMFSIEKAQPHRIETLAGAARLFDFFEEAHKGCSQ